jgi:hypothetical protein
MTNFNGKRTRTSETIAGTTNQARTTKQSMNLKSKA